MKDKYIDQSRLQVGDVLLSLSTEKKSTLIAKATRGNYSHAAIFVRDYLQFEAVSEGVGFSYLVPERAECKNETKWRILCSTDQYSKFAVYRCPANCRVGASTDDSQLYFKMSSLLDELDGSEYTRLGGFANIDSAFNFIPKAMREKILRAAGKIAGDSKKIILEEYFCSELVTRVLSVMGMTVLKQPLGCDEISPNSLADSSISNLEEVTGVVCTKNPQCDCPPDDFWLTSAKNIAWDMGTSRIKKHRREITILAEQILEAMKQDQAARHARGNY